MPVPAFAAYSGPELAARLRASDPAAALRQLKAAHAALVRAVVDGTTRSFIEMTFAVDEFARSAEALFVAYDAYLSVLAH